MEKNPYLNAWFYNRRKKPWRAMKGLMKQKGSLLRPFFLAALGSLAALELFLLCMEWEPAEEFLKQLVTTGSYTEVKPGTEDGKEQTERGVSIDLKEGRIRLWRSEETGVKKSD